MRTISGKSQDFWLSINI